MTSNSVKGQVNRAKELQNSKKLLDDFLLRHTVYDVLPLSFRVVILDVNLLVKKALFILLQNGVNSAPLYDAKNGKFAGMLTMTDLIRLIHHYYNNSSAYSSIITELENFEIKTLREKLKEYAIEESSSLTNLSPLATLKEAATLMAQKGGVRRLPLIEQNPDTGQDLVVCVLTQYRLIRFIATNFLQLSQLKASLQDLKVGSFKDIATAEMSTPVIEIIRMFVEKRVTAIPIVNNQGVLLNVYEKADVLNLLLGGNYNDLDMPVSSALLRRSEDFEGVHTCHINDTLYSMLATLRKTRVHRFMVVDKENKLIGVVTLSDILNFLLNINDMDKA